MTSSNSCKKCKEIDESYDHEIYPSSVKHRKELHAEIDKMKAENDSLQRQLSMFSECSEQDDEAYDILKRELVKRDETIKKIKKLYRECFTPVSEDEDNFDSNKFIEGIEKILSEAKK